jgi:acyl carrier protein
LASNPTDKSVTYSCQFLSGQPLLSFSEYQPCESQGRIGTAKQFTPLNLGARIIAEVTDHTIQDRVLKVIATTKRIPLENVRPDSSFESLEIDSLDRLNILFGLESEFDIEINDEDAKHIQNIHEMIEGITQLLQARTPSSPSE